MTSHNRKSCLYAIEATGIDSDGTRFEYFDAARGWRFAVQATSEMFRRVPGMATFKIYQGDPDTGEFRDVTVDLLACAETAFHKASEHRADRTKVRRMFSNFWRAA